MNGTVVSNRCNFKDHRLFINISETTPLVPKEIKNNEYRVGMTPTAVSTLVAEGHSVSVEYNAGSGSGFQNEAYIDAGAQIVENPKEVYRAYMIIKVKEPLPQDHKLRFLPNALLLPHLGYVTVENYSKFYNQMIEALESCVNGKPIRVIEQ